MATSETADRVARGRRVADLRELCDLTVVAFADELNQIARALDLPERWTGPKVSKIEVGSQNLVIEDVACLAAYDPKERGWFWWYFGREQPRVKRPALGRGAPRLDLREPQRPVIPRGKQGRG